MFRWKTDIAVGQRFFQPQWQAILVATSNQRRARSGTDCRIGVGLQEAHALRSHAVDVRRIEVGTPVASYVGISEIISHDEDYVWRSRHRLTKDVFDA